MISISKEPFGDFMSHLVKSNQTLDSFCDFPKIERNVADIRLSLCVLNSLIGVQDLQQAVTAIWRRDPTAFEVLGILIAVRDDGRKYVLDSLGACVPLTQMFSSIEGVLDFLQKTGLAEMLRKQKVKNLVDYVFGIETGLDSNGRKNRGGHVMEATVERILVNHAIAYRKEVNSNEWPQLKNALGDDEKRFDFVLQTFDMNYLMEVNFYNSGGSKLNEVARSYSELSPRINAVAGFTFIWVTDGQGWKSARNKLQEAYGIIDHVYNLNNLGNFLQSLSPKK